MNEYNSSYSWSFNLSALQRGGVLKHLQPDHADKILEIGCNRGSLVKILQEAGYDVVGIDANEAAVIRSVTNGVTYMDATSLDFDDNSYDRIFSVHTIEHIPDLPKALSEMERILKPGGRLVLIYPAEPIRGIFVLFRAIVAHGNPMMARRIHIHKLWPSKLRSMMNELKLIHRSSHFPIFVTPQFISVFDKLVAD